MKRTNTDSKTFFFSDIEGSTRLARQLGESYALILERHRTVIRMACSEFKGKEIDTSGDGFFIVFDRPEQAVAAAVAIQKNFAAKKWACDVGLKVRIGLHYGQALSTKSGLTGLEVHRASRICSIGHGGQILLSRKVRDKVRNSLPAEVTLREIGKVQLKDFEQSDSIWQLDVAGLESSFPPLRLAMNKPSVAVMPFVNLSDDPEQDYFCEGISEEIILALDNIAGLNVVSRASSFSLKGKPLNVREKGRQLGAVAVLEGTVRKNGHQLRITAELVDTETGTILWSGKFERRLEDVFELQDVIAQNIVRALEVKLSPERDILIQERQTRNVEAYEYYLKGRHFYYQFSRKSVRQALPMFKKAIDIDDEYALAYCGLADCYSYLFMYDEDSEENLKEANLASLQALELAPLLAEAHTSRGIALILRNQFKKAEIAFEKAIELNPSLFIAWYHYGRVCFTRGKLDKAARLFDEASRHRPDDYQSVLLASQAYDNLGIRVLAEKSRQRGLLIAEKQLQRNPNDIRALYLGALALVTMGETGRGLDWLRRAMALDPGDPMLLYNAGCVAARLDRSEEALYYLEQSFISGLKQKGWYEYDGSLDNLRDHPRFQALLEKMD
ncbi:MAG: hypothetical protein RI973_1560 [Bacteroidota bacterium]|jgi:TolB-like protein/Tfp pilus assembly protein PilF